MEVIYVTSKYKPSKSQCILCLGIFDGVHLGHSFIIEKCIRQAHLSKLPSAVLTFLPHPANVLNPKKPLKMLSTFDQRLELLEKLGIDICFVIRFNKVFARASGEEFVKNILVRLLRPKTILVGDDFRFGAGSKGNIKLLKSLSKKLGFRLQAIKCHRKDAKKVSSSLIRGLLESGRIKEANRFLGRFYCVEGIVVKGMCLGTDIGFPTANIDYPKEIILPLGVFSGFFRCAGKIHPAAIFVGFKRMFMEKNKIPLIEVHIFDFKRNIYGENAQIYFVKKIRDEKKFSSLYALREAIKRDIQEARNDLKLS